MIAPNVARLQSDSRAGASPSILLSVEPALEEALIAAARDQAPVSGLTHNFYRYPARFSPRFVRAAIEALTSPGDYVMDPFVGGGTTLVEALSLGRNSIGIDISELATFVAEVKTMLFSDEEFQVLERWAKRVPRRVHMGGDAVPSDRYAEAGYYKYLDAASTWRLRKAIGQAIATAVRLRSPRLQAFGRCVALRTAQWALDGRKKLPMIAEFRARLGENAVEMITGARALRSAVEGLSAPGPASVRLCRLNASDLGVMDGLARGPSPKLVLTSPPYPGVHVLYHRWQVDGRKETAAPFWIANRLDGSGAAYYSMGDRKAPELRTYFLQIAAAMTNVAKLCDDNTVVVQVVAFNEPAWQLPRYLEANAAAGMQEMRLPLLAGHRDGRLWRTVPNRRWYADQMGETHGSQEVVLFHRIAVAD